MLTTAINHGVMVDVLAKTRYQRNIGIQDGKIVQISDRPLKAERVIDASGLTVSPGFIDVHSHVDGDNYAGILSVCQGITTTIGGNCGCSPVNLGEFFSRTGKKRFSHSPGHVDRSSDITSRGGRSGR